MQEALAKEAGTLSKIGKSMEKPSVAAQNLLKTGMKNTLAEEAKSKNLKRVLLILQRIIMIKFKKIYKLL